MYISACKNHKHPRFFSSSTCVHTSCRESKILAYLLTYFHSNCCFSFSFLLVFFSIPSCYFFLAQHEIEFHDMHLIDSQLLWVSRQCPRFFCTLNISSIRMNCITLYIVICFPTCGITIIIPMCMNIWHGWNSWCLLQIYSKHFFLFL